MKIKKFLNNYVKSIFHSFSRTYIGEKFCDFLLEAGMNNRVSVNHSNVEMLFASPNALTNYRYATFASKEPDTLNWIEKIPNGAVFWDIGANIGLYSVYAARKSGARVYAFEPSVFNTELLARNIFLNNLQKNISIISIPVSDNIGASMFNMSSTTWGGALHTFGKGIDQQGDKHDTVFEYQTFGMTMDGATRLLDIPAPDYIKIDVDGIEHFILRCGTEVLRNATSVLIEINDDFIEQANESFYHLTNAGLTLYRKCDINSGNQYNQWWIRRST